MQRFRALCQRYAGWIVVTLVLLLCQRWWIARNRPERLVELPKGYDFTSLRDGAIFLKKQDTSPLQEGVKYIQRPGSKRPVPVATFSSHSPRSPATSLLFAMPVMGGPLRPVSSDSLEAAPSDTIFTTGANSYRVEYRKTASTLAGIPPGYGSNYGFGGGGTIGDAGGAPPPKPKPPFHTVTYRDEANGVTATLRHVTSSDAPSSESIPLLLGYFSKGSMPPGEAQPFTFKQKLAFSGDAVYWIKSFPDERTLHVSSDRQFVGKAVYKYRSAVMTTPLRGGTPRKLLDNISSDAMLFASQDGVLYQGKRGDRIEWLLVRPDGTSHQVRTDASPYDPPVEWDHCLYWSNSDSVGSSTLRIMQANIDGSIPHVLYTVSNAGSIDLKTWHGHVYFRVVDAPLQGQSVSMSKSTLYRVNPTLPSGVERLCSLPDNIEQWSFDGDYVYCLAYEKKTGLMDTFRANAAVEPRHVLYRYRLLAK